MTTAFVLPGGSTMGAIQVGMAEALFDAGIQPDMIIGKSAGALNGAWLAGHPGPEGVKALRDLWMSVKRREIFPLSTSLILGLAGRRDHLISPDALERWLHSHAPFPLIENAAIPLHVMATDLMSGVAVRLSTGATVTALLASAAIPGIFPPVEWEGRLLVDGGVGPDTAIASAIALGADTVYVLPTMGADVGRPRTPAAAFLLSMSHVLRHSAEAELRANAGLCTLYLVAAPTIANVSLFSFARTAQLMDDAHVAAREWLETATPVRPHIDA
jgi:NTE family protein